jgi:RNA polymerase sigma-70 factor, ECF subfamily
MVFATAVRLLGDPADAEDAAQTVFLKAFERFDDLRENPAAAGWLKTATRNACLNHLSRYRSRWRFFSEIDDRATDAAYADTIESSAAPIDDLLERADVAQALEEALRALPDHQRVPLVLFHFEGASYDEIARTLGVSLGKVKTDVHRGRLALRRYLERGARGVRGEIA